MKQRGREGWSRDRGVGIRESRGSVAGYRFVGGGRRGWRGPKGRGW